MPYDIGDRGSVLFEGLSGFWQRFFKDTVDIQAFYQSSEMYLGQVYLDLMSSILNIGIVDTPIFNKEVWKLFTISETELNYSAGIVPSEDRYIYDMPGDIVHTSVLQNTIFEPEVALELDVDFDIADNDGLLRFREDPFRAITDLNGNWLPLSGVAWRTLRVAVGNNVGDLNDKYQDTPINYYEEGVRKGDTFRLLAQCRYVTYEGTSGSMAVTPTVSYVYGTDIHLCTVGDLIYIYANAGGVGDDKYLGYYIVKSIDIGFPNRVEVDSTTINFPELGSSVSALSWKVYRAVYEESFRDYEIDYIDDVNNKLVGSSDNSFPLDTEGILLYSIVRNSATPNEYNVPISFSVVTPVPPLATDLGKKNIVVGSVTVLAYRENGTEPDDGVLVVEGVDYKIDYLHGILYQLTSWKLNSPGRCNFSYMDEVLLSAGGTISEQDVGSVKQLSFWVPDVTIDRFTLWYNYGSLLNRFEASSEEYKNFLQGVMHLYATGPVLERIEAALNVTAGYFVVKTDGEVLESYYNGVDASGSAAEIVAASTSIIIPVSEHQLTELDVGGFVVISEASNANNIGRFKITEINSVDNIAILDTFYGFTDEVGLSWVISREYVKRVVTDKRTYTYPYNVPIREDVQLSTNIGVLTFSAFEPLTTGFTVTDYVEDPEWWHNKYIPPVLWASDTAARRHASTKLYEHVIGAEDDPRIGDPYYYIGAGDDGVVLNPNDSSVIPGLGNFVSLHRHKLAFTLFDKFFKCHMFFVDVSPDLELDRQFKTDLEELILVAKPSYTYPYIEPSELFRDILQLTDDFNIGNITFLFGGEEDSGLDALHVSENTLVVGDPNYPWKIGDFFRYSYSSDIAIPGAPVGPPTAGTVFQIALPSDVRPININFRGTVGGASLLEGRDYTVNWLSEYPLGTVNPNIWQVTLLTTWDGVVFPNMDLRAVTIIPSSSYVAANGDTPLMIGGGNPFYIRKGALDPDSVTYPVDWAAVRTEYVDRPLQLTITDTSGAYIYP